MGNETMNYKLPKPGEDDFYDIAEFNKAMDTLDEALTGLENEKLDRDGDASDTFTVFNQEVLRENLTSGEKLSVSLGKAKKWFAELKNVAFSGKASDITEDTAHRFVGDSEKNNWNGKVSESGGDISNTKIGSLDTITTEFPIPAEGETSKVFLGKVRKFMQDFNNLKTGIITVGKLVNNGQTTVAGYALDARYGKTLYDLYIQLNSDLHNKMDYKSEVLDSITAIKENYNTLSDYTIVSGFGTRLDPLNDGSSFAGMYTIQRHVAEYGTIMILTNGLIFTNFRSGGKWGNWELYSKNCDLTYEVISSTSDAYSFSKLIKDKATGLHIYQYTRKILVDNNATVATISSGHYPAVDVYSNALCVHEISGLGIGQLLVDSNGQVKLGSTEYNEKLRGAFTVYW